MTDLLSTDMPNNLAERPLSSIDKTMQPIEDFANLMAGFAIFMLMVLGVSQIFLRTVMNAPISGYIDLVELSMASMAFLGVAYCQRMGAHIRMEILVGKLKGRWLWTAEIFGTLVALFIVGVLIWYGWGHFLRSYQLGDTTIDAEFPVWPSKLLVPFAFAIWFVRLLIQLMGSIRMLINPTLEPIGIAKILDVETIAKDEIKEAFGEAVSDTENTRDRNTP